MEGVGWVGGWRMGRGCYENVIYIYIYIYVYVFFCHPLLHAVTSFKSERSARRRKTLRRLLRLAEAISWAPTGSGMWWGLPIGIPLSTRCATLRAVAALGGAL